MSDKKAVQDAAKANAKIAICRAKSPTGELPSERAMRLAMEKHKNTNSLAWVAPEKLSDSSNAYNVVMDAADDTRITLGCFSKAHADAVAEIINEGVSWIETFKD